MKNLLTKKQIYHGKLASEWNQLFHSPLPKIAASTALDYKVSIASFAKGYGLHFNTAVNLELFVARQEDNLPEIFDNFINGFHA